MRQEATELYTPDRERNRHSEVILHRIIHSDMNFKCFKEERAQDLTEANKNKRLVCAKRLIRRYPEHTVSFI